MKRGLDTDEVVERFRRERRILSRLDHPNIARLLDGGATEEGLPYLVMEYVEGTPLLEYARTMDLNARLDLFRKVCEGVEYAHRNLVIHRDLKPANILVTAETGAPKLLDFGIAKLLSSEDTSHTAPEQRLLTPDYASPEQKAGALVTTATDIYSLGRILEELVKGVRASYEVAQIIGKARHEDAERRYATVEQLSEDVRRYLAGLPVLARGDAALYRARKFLRRNLWTVLAATAAMISLLAGIVVSTIQARRAERRFHAAHGFANLVVRDISRRLQQTRGALVVAKDLIGGAVRMLDALSKDAANDRALQFDLGVGYFRVSSLQWSLDGPNLGEFDGCMENAGKARDILEPLLRLEPGNRDVQHQLGQVYKQLGWCSWGTGDYEDEIRWARKAEPLLRASDPYPETGYGSNQHFTIPGDIGGALVQLGRCREALKIYRYRPGVERDVLARFGIGSALECEGDIDGAEKQYSGVTYDGKRLLGGLIATDQVIFLRGNLLGNPLHLNLGLRDEGLKLVRQSLMRHETVFQRDPADMFAKILLA
ncbi:MAG: serine/threonine protein kinase [Bryobacterales bacterium]|nr:serine/threonine protein kinase [Bryobacterales bacterium]